MTGASRQDEEVPQLVEPEHSWDQVGPLEAVDQGPGAIDETTAEDPGDTARRYRLEDGRGGDHGEPAHSQVDSYREPARGFHPEELERDAAQSQRPDQAEQTRPPATLQREHADRGVSSRYEDEDRHVVQPPQPRGRGRRDRQKMVKGARAVQGDEAETEDAESHKLVHPARRPHQQDYQRDQGQQNPRKMGEPAYGFPQLPLHPSSSPGALPNITTQPLCTIIATSAPTIDVRPRDRIIHLT